ncbi:hypothetical protein HanPI659440_Chr01g0013621 [Helianthus annuus]|nr:hypothetical protein HanPI659440_Chr01g0013621 [Helianthus annuus]
MRPIDFAVCLGCQHRSFDFQINLVGNSTYVSVRASSLCLLHSIQDKNIEEATDGKVVE